MIKVKQKKKKIEKLFATYNYPWYIKELLKGREDLKLYRKWTKDISRKTNENGL